MALSDFLGIPAEIGMSPDVLPALPGADMAGAAAALPQMAAMPQRQGGGGLFSGGLKFGSPLRNFLGALGDALLVYNGQQPLYQQRRQQQQRQSAVSQYLGNLDPQLAEMIGGGLDADTAVSLYKLTHSKEDEPETIRLLRAAGIDPATDEGKAIIRQKLAGGGDSPNFVRELDALGIDPHSRQALELYYGRNSPAGYLLKPPPLGGTVGGSEALPTINSQEDYDKLPVGTRYRDSQGNVGVKGGATASTPSPTFR